MEALGRHVIVEFYECESELLNDVVHIEESMIAAAETAGATVINSSFHHFSPYGVSGVVVIQESHLAIHTWPEYGFASVDLFTCGDSVNPWVSNEFLQKAFKSKHRSAVEMRRGQISHLVKRDFDINKMRDESKNYENAPVSTRNVWFTERDERIALSLKHHGRLFSKKSDFQNVEIYNTEAYGNMLTLDGMVMTTEKDEYVYHEMISHIPMLTHPNPERVLVIGGGDGGTVREILKHEIVKEVVMVEIDGIVIDACKEHLPSIASALDHPKLNLLVEDGLNYIDECPSNSFDLIIVDSTDPIGPGEGLFTSEFYKKVHDRLTENGIMVTQSESPRFNTKVFQEIYQCYRGIFGKGNVHCYLAAIPTYPTGNWSFSYCSKGSTNPLAMDYEKVKSFCAKHDLNYYNHQIHTAAFALPNYVQKLLNE